MCLYLQVVFSKGFGGSNASFGSSDNAVLLFEFPNGRCVHDKVGPREKDGSGCLGDNVGKDVFPVEGGGGPEEGKGNTDGGVEVSPRNGARGGNGQSHGNDPDGGNLKQSLKSVGKDGRHDSTRTKGHNHTGTDELRQQLTHKLFGSDFSLKRSDRVDFEHLRTALVMDRIGTLWCHNCLFNVLFIRHDGIRLHVFFRSRSNAVLVVIVARHRRSLKIRLFFTGPLERKTYPLLEHTLIYTAVGRKSTSTNNA